MSYTTKIIENLINNGHYYVSNPFGSELSLQEHPEVLRAKLQHIPEENLKVVLSNFDKLVVNDGRHCCSEFIQAAAEAGYLKFDPFVVKRKDGSATLVLRWNRFVHLFHGYNYQVSYTFEGIGEYQSACVRMDSLLNKYRGIRDSRLMKVLLYINCINACTGIDAFTETLNKHPEVIDDFVATTAHRYFSSYDITYADVKSYIVDVTNTPNILGEPLQVFHMYKSATSDICRLHVHSSMVVEVEFSNNGNYCRYQVALPNWREGLSETSDAICEDSDIYDEDTSADIEILVSAVCLALNCIGIVINYNVAYPVTKSNHSIKAINHNLVKELDSLDSIYKMRGLL